MGKPSLDARGRRPTRDRFRGAKRPGSEPGGEDEGGSAAPPPAEPGGNTIRYAHRRKDAGGVRVQGPAPRRRRPRQPRIQNCARTAPGGLPEGGGGLRQCAIVFRLPPVRIHRALVARYLRGSSAERALCSASLVDASACLSAWGSGTRNRAADLFCFLYRRREGWGTEDA